MRQSMMRCLAALVLAGGIIAYAQQPAAAAESCWYAGGWCYLAGGYWFPSGAEPQCWDGSWNVEYICFPFGAQWCDSGSQCTTCVPGDNCPA